MGSAGDRIAWMDVARAMAVIVVVLLNVTIWASSPAHQQPASTALWSSLNSVITPLRIPALMFQSGALLSSGTTTRIGDRL